MRVILLAGYRLCSEQNPPWLEVEANRTKLERRIQEALNLGSKCVVVLAGSSADRALASCPSLEKCELVFDAQNDQADLLSNLRAALSLAEEPSIVLPAELEFANVDDLKGLVALAVQHGRAPYHILHKENNPFPLVLTNRGCAEILRNKSLQNLADRQLVRHTP